MRLKIITSSIIAATLFLGSCSTPKNITYFQDITDGAVINPIQQLDIKVKPEDKLSIMVTTQDPALSNLFNLVQVNTRLGANTTASTTSSYTSESHISYYTVNKLGDINFPVVGDIHIGGLTRSEVAEYIETKLKDSNLVKDPIVTVEFVNTGMSIIGEVAKPGRYEFNKDRMNIIDAIAMAGDLTPNGQRENVIVFREIEGGKHQAYKVNLTDLSSIADSRVFYLQQNDVIYVEPNDKKKRETTASGNSAYNPSFWVSIGSLGVTIATLIITLSK